MTDEEAPDYSTIWDADALLAKTQRYAEKMQTASRDDWEFALWSTLALEFLLRACLAAYSPTLLADVKSDWNNLLSAVGIGPTAKKFIPKSISTKETIERLNAMVVEFNAELAGFSHRHTSKRNAELHSGEIAFDDVKHSSWLPMFYRTCKVLLVDMGHDLPHVFGKEEAAIAEKLITALADDAAKAVKATINAHKTVWDKKEKADRDKVSILATLWATKHVGHRVTCPACASNAIVTGEAISAAQKSIKGDIITEKQEHLPSKFECIACGMKIAGLSQLTAAGLGDVYAQTQSYDAGEYYAPAEPDEYHDWEPDNNEPA